MLGSTSRGLERGRERVGCNTREQADFWIQEWGGHKLKGSCAGRAIRIDSLNIRSGQSGGLETALQVLQKGNVGVGILQETNLTEGIHTRHRAG